MSVLLMSAKGRRGHSPPLAGRFPVGNPIGSFGVQISSSAPEIMVVDDDPHVLEALSDFLGDEGFRVRDAVNGADALEQLGRLRALRDLPALLILDLAMPIMDGYQLLEEIQEDHQLSPIPILVLSATINREDLPEYIASLRKPIDSQVLVATIRDILGGRYPS
jgi:CheY-like chemotaxis protein